MPRWKSLKIHEYERHDNESYGELTRRKVFLSNVVARWLSIDVHLLFTLLAPSFTFDTLPLAFLSKHSLQVFRPTVHILGIVGVLEWTWIMQIGQLLC